MKYIILTSSIFYLLGLKITSNIDLKSKLQNDSVQPAKKEVFQLKVTSKTEKHKQTYTVKKDSTVVATGGGTNELLAPSYKCQ